MFLRLLSIVTMLGICSTAMAAQRTVTRADQNFIRQTSQSGLLEVQLSTLAAQKATDPAVKQLSQQEMTERSQINDQLAAIAKRNNVALSNTLDAAHQARLDKFSQLNGPALDREYLKSMERIHARSVTSFQKEAQTTQNSEIRNFAISTLPTLKEHLQVAQNLESKMMQGVGGTGGAGSSDSAPATEEPPNQ